MHNAPSVSFPVGRCAFLRTLYIILTLLTSAVLLSWTLVQPWHIGMGFALCLGVLCAGWGWRDSQWQGVLHWTGQQWQLEDASDRVTGALAVGTPQVCLDAQSILLLRLTPLSGATAAKRWLWCQRRNATPQWQDVRRAVYAAQTSSRRDQT
jgi:hypothetical protein